MGSDLIEHRAATVLSVVASKSYNTFLTNINALYEYKIGFVPAGYAHRPDLISNLFFGTPAYWWLLMEVNNVTDPFEGFDVGDRILIPQIA